MPDQEVRARGGRGAGQVPPARRQRGLRGARAHGAGLLDARAPGAPPQGFSQDLEVAGCTPVLLPAACAAAPGCMFPGLHEPESKKDPSNQPWVAGKTVLIPSFLP